MTHILEVHLMHQDTQQEVGVLHMRSQQEGSRAEGALHKHLRNFLLVVDTPLHPAGDIAVDYMDSLRCSLSNNQRGFVQTRQ
jgi:hypothetical protein